MILVQGIGMSGYVPLEGVVGLSHFYLNYLSGKCEYKFNYLLGTESSETAGFDVIRRVVSFAVINRFNETARFLIVRGLCPFSGYHRAGVVFPIELFAVFEDLMGLKEYGKWTYMFPHSGFSSSCASYDFGQLVYTTAWAEYICIDAINSSGSFPSFLVQMLGRFEMALPNFRCDELRKELMG